jgi:AraC family transcriptional regulator
MICIFYGVERVMQIKSLCQSQSLSILDYRCTAAPHEEPFTEHFMTHSISYVRKGSFGCQMRGRHFELVPGSLLIGHTGDEYLCTHDHHCGGDECLSFQLTPEFADQMGDATKVWRQGRLPPLAQLVVLGELAWSATQGLSHVSAEEIGLLLTNRYVEVVSGQTKPALKVDARQRKRAVQLAVWIGDNSQTELSLDTIANEAGCSPFHFLRVFTRTLGVTPHQYLLLSRLRHAAQLLTEEGRSITDIAFDVGFNDLSNFIRTFHRAARMSPSLFREFARRESKLLHA